MLFACDRTGWKKVALGLAAGYALAAAPAQAGFDSFRLRLSEPAAERYGDLPSFARLNRIVPQDLPAGAPYRIMVTPAQIQEPTASRPGTLHRVLLASLGGDTLRSTLPQESFTAKRPAVSDGTPRDLSGSVAIRISGSVHDRNWRRILSERADSALEEPCTPDRAICRSQIFRRLQKTVADAAGMETAAKVRLINEAVNGAIRYQTDLDNYGAADYWATFGETVGRGRGDCEDFAIVKMWMLRAAGVNERDMHLVIGRELRGQQDHAVLAVRAESGETVYLDNLTNRVTSAARRDAFMPLVSLSVAGTWIHGFRSAAAPAPR